jgi:hypothetical protein
MFSAATFLIIIVRKIQHTSIKKLSILLSLFLYIHGLYHIVDELEIFYPEHILELISDAILEPLSIFVFLIFTLILTGTR